MAAESTGFDDFICESVLGEGGMGKVYRARQISLDRWVALKVLPRASESGSFIDRFKREARSAAALVHPNIIQIYTFGELKGIPYFAMEYIEGEDLENILRVSADKLTTDEIIEIIRSVTKALAVAMERGIVHRDIKPANIMLTRSGLVKVMDFGLAKGITNEAVTQAGLVVGTPAYMSPEQGASRPVDTRSDIYSLGCVMYNCLCGQAPFTAENVASLLYKHMYEPPEPPEKFRPDINPDITTICLKMLAKKPEERYQNPQELLEALVGININAAAAELSLARRATKAFTEKRASGGARQKTEITPDAFRAMAGKEDSSAAQTTVRAATPMEPRPVPPLLDSMPGIPPPPPPPTVQPAQPASSSKVVLPPGALNRQPGSSPVIVAPASGKVIMPPPPSAPSATGSSPKFVLPPGVRKPISRISDTFVKLADGRWSYSVDLGRCNHAEGLAHELSPLPGEKAHGLGDCLLCANWNKRVGCAVASCRELESNNRYKGLKLLVEQAIIWTGAGRFDKAIALMEEFIKNSPDEPEAYRELARIYEHPEYRGKEKRRAIVLYRRFLDLARASGTFQPMDITRAEERVGVLMNMPSESKSSILMPGTGVAFQCFYRGKITCFGYGLLTAERLVIARAGEVDPESGIHSSDMGGAMGRATTIFRRLKSEQAKKDEQSNVKRELTRLSEVPVEDLPKEPSCVANIPCEQMMGVEMSIDTAVNIRCVSIKTSPMSQQLLFTEGGAFKAEQCHELLKRRIKAQAPTA